MRIPQNRVRRSRLRVYCGDTRSRRLLAEFRRRGIGAVAIRGSLHLRVLSPWFFDNGAFVDWKAGRAFDGEAFRADLARIAADPDSPPDFIVAPDIVGGGRASLALSLEWLPELRRQPRPVYLAVQDGFESMTLPISQFDGVFIGGASVAWKCRTGPYWADLTRAARLPLHFARCGNARRVAFARALGCASLDSSLPLWSSRKMALFTRALDQCELLSEFTR